MAIIMAFHLLWRTGRNWFEDTSLYVSMAAFSTRQAYLAAAIISEQLMGNALVRLDSVNTFIFHAASPAGTQTRQLIIDHTCSGLKQFYQAFFLFLLYPGPWKHKVWFIPMAIAVMHLVNVLRIVVLSLAMLHAYHQWGFIHDWVVRPMFYVVLFGLWVWWDQRSGG